MLVVFGHELLRHRHVQRVARVRLLEFGQPPQPRRHVLQVLGLVLGEQLSRLGVIGEELFELGVQQRA